MFRKMRRFRQELPPEECEAVLQEQPRGVMAVHGEDGYPYAFPLNYVYMDGKLYFHCAKEGHKLDAIAEDNRVSFCVMDQGKRKEGDWALDIRSIVIFGKVRMLDVSEETERILLRIAEKYYPTQEEAEEEVRKGISRVQLLEMNIDHMTGKLVNEK